MLRSLSRTQALVAILALLALAGFSLTIRPAPEDAAITGDGRYSDVRLYEDIAGALAAGEPYYRAATRLHRAHGFPTQPFVTVRLPTLAWAEAALGWPAMRAILAALLGASALAWLAALRGTVAPAERIAATLLVLAGGAMAARADLVVTHELWAGVLVSLATALLAGGRWLPAVFAAALAVAVRELALPFALVAALLALRDRDWPQVAAWGALLLAGAAMLLLHKLAVDPLSQPGDALSQGWSGLRGAGAPLRDLVDVTLLGLLPRPFAYLVALLAIAGFLAAPPPLARIALAWLAVVCLMLGVFARPVNFYWAILAIPTVLAGLAFVPRLVGDLAHAVRRR